MDVEKTLGKTGALQTGMLGRINATLEELVELSGQESPEADRAFELFHQLFSSFDSLTEEANRFLFELNVQVKTAASDEETFLMRKQAVIAYLSRFIKHQRELSDSIAESLDQLIEDRIGILVGAASASGDIPPAMDDRDPAAIWRQDCLERFSGVRAWFSASEGGEATVDHLAAVAQQAVVDLTRLLARLHERRTRPADRAADFRALARWFARCESDGRAHELWQVAFGMRPSRHFQMAEDDPETVDPGASWWDAQPVDVPVRLRTHGRVSRAGRPSPAPDHESAKRWIAARLRQARERERRAKERFADKGPLLLSDIVEIDNGELELLLSLLEQALDTPRTRDGIQRAHSVDGTLEVTIDRNELANGRVAVIRTSGGEIRCPDLRIEVRSVRARADTTAEKSS